MHRSIHLFLSLSHTFNSRYGTDNASLWLLQSTHSIARSLVHFSAFVWAHVSAFFNTDTQIAGFPILTYISLSSRSSYVLYVVLVCFFQRKTVIKEIDVVQNDSVVVLNSAWIDEAVALLKRNIPLFKESLGVRKFKKISFFFIFKV